jgi:hypothetical protein
MQAAMYFSGYFYDTLRPADNQAANYLIGNSNSQSGAVYGSMMSMEILYGQMFLRQRMVVFLYQI